MASRNYRAFGRAAKKLVRPPAKTVVFSLVAFLIVAAAPWLIIQTDAVTEDSVKMPIDSEALGFNRVQYYDGSWKNFETDPTVVSPEMSGDGSYLVFSDGSFSSTSSPSIYSYTFTIDSEILDDDLISEFQVTVSEGMILHSLSIFLGSEAISLETETLDDGTIVCKLSELDRYRYSALENPSFAIKFSPEVYPSDLPEFSFTLEAITYEDDYSGTIIAFVAGVVLIVLAVLSTNFINPTKWGKRR